MKGLFAVILLGVGVLGGCTAEAGDEAFGDDLGQDDAELRAFRAGEVVGPIVPGEQKDVAHPGGSNVYRAFSFQAQAGETFQAQVRARSEDAVAWITDARNVTLMRATAAASNATETLSFTAKKAGTYHVVFRTKSHKAASFLVGLYREDPLPTCAGTPTFPQSRLMFASGTKSNYVRTCDAFGVCTPWRRESQQSVRGDNGSGSMTLYPDGNVSLWLQVGQSTLSQSGSSTYVCKSQDIGSVSVGADGVGTGRMRSGYRCNISGGSGGPYGDDDQRSVSAKLGSTCLAVVDVAPRVQGGQQRMSALQFTW
jgi:hypothetical protein